MHILILVYTFLSMPKGRKYAFLTFLGLACSILIYGQSCECEKNLRHLISKVEANYSGFNDKVKKQNKTEYKNLCNKLISKSREAYGVTCYNLLSAYTNYFNDAHLYTTIAMPFRDSSVIREFYSEAPKLFFDTAKIYNGKYSFTDPIEGVWDLQFDKSYYRTLIIKKNKNNFIGITLIGDGLFWTKWQIKFEITKINRFKYRLKYYNLFHNSFTELVEIRNASQLLIYGNLWNRVYPKPPVQESSRGLEKLPYTHFERISSKTNLICLPNFAIENIRLVDNFIAENDSLIRNTENLIVDIRNNSGGTGRVYANLTPYFYTNPIKAFEGLYKSSDDIIEFYKRELEDSTISQNEYRRTSMLIERLKKNKGKLIDFDPVTFYRQDSIFPFPKRIAIIINGNCMSAAELFLLGFKQSKKTIIFGQRTKGAIDYPNMLINQPLLCNFFNYSFAMSKRKNAEKKPIDNIGIPPDIQLNGPEREWLDKVIKYLESN